jgi:hypothetical protein
VAAACAQNVQICTATIMLSIRLSFAHTGSARGYHELRTSLAA